MTMVLRWTSTRAPCLLDGLFVGICWDVDGYYCFILSLGPSMCINRYPFGIPLYNLSLKVKGLSFFLSFSVFKAVLVTRAYSAWRS